LEDRSLFSFVAPLSFQVDIRPSNLAVGDFNGDGIPDLAVTNENFGPGTLVIMLGNGDGTFRRGATYNVGNNAYSVAVADFNGDNQLDLAVANRLGHTVSILLGNGDGTFRAGSTLSFNGDPYSLAVADFNQDGNLDLVAAGEGNSGVGIFLGNGDGTFRPAQYYPTGDTPLSVAVGDFNGDGNIDLATGNSGSFPLYTGTVSVLLGNGDGSFQTHRDYVTGSGTHSVAVGDLNGDGTPDLVAANQRNQTISVLLGNGDGTFRYGDVYRTPPSPAAVVLADVNGDGRLDIVAANPYGNAVTVLLGNDGGTFQDPRDYLTGATPLAVVVADVNGDGRLDLVTANWGNTSITVLPGNGDGTFLTVPSSPAGTNPSFLATGDFTNDGIPDLAVADAGDVSLNLPSSVSILAGRGDGTFQTVNTFPVGLGNLRFVTGEFNGDGNLDLAVIYSGNPGNFRNPDPGGLDIFLGNGDGTFQPPRTYMVGTGPSLLVASDVNGDGRLDLVVFSAVDQQLRVLLGNGDGTFQAGPTFHPSPVPAFLAAGDFNNDGHADLALYGTRGLGILLGNGDGTFQPAITYNIDGSPRALVVADFNGDGQLDLAVSTYLGPTYTSPGRVSIFRGNGDGTFQPPLNLTTLAGPADLAVGDFNGDGIPDLAVLTSPGLSVFLGNGDGSFQPGPAYATGNSIGLAVGDFTRGPLPDVATVDVAVRVYRNAADWTTKPGVPSRVRPRFVSESAVARALPGGSSGPSLVWVVKVDRVSNQLLSAHESLAAAGSYLGTWPPDEGARDMPWPSQRPNWLLVKATEWPLRDEDGQDLLWFLLGRGGLV
jgi:hypothetical protein